MPDVPSIVILSSSKKRRKGFKDRWTGPVFTAVSSAWILFTGGWNDSGYWRDTSTWSDS